MKRTFAGILLIGSLAVQASGASAQNEVGPPVPAIVRMCLHQSDTPVGQYWVVTHEDQDYGESCVFVFFPAGTTTTTATTAPWLLSGVIDWYPPQGKGTEAHPTATWMWDWTVRNTTRVHTKAGSPNWSPTFLGDARFGYFVAKPKVSAYLAFRRGPFIAQLTGTDPTLNRAVLTRFAGLMDSRIVAYRKAYPTT